MGTFCEAKKDVSRENKTMMEGKKKKCCRAAEEKGVGYGGGGWLRHTEGTGYQCCGGKATRANTVATIRCSCSGFNASQMLQSIMYSE